MQKLMAYLDHQAQAFPLMNALSRILRLSPGMTLVLTTFAMLVLMSCGKSTGVVCDAIGLLYPGYKTYKVIKHFDANPSIRRAATEELSGAIGIDGSLPQEQLLFWAKYWVVYSLAFALKYPLAALFFWFPLFEVCKLFFTVALFHPKLKGAEGVFNILVFPFLIQYERHIDSSLDYVESKIGTFVKSHCGKTFESKVKKNISNKLAKAEAGLNAAAMLIKSINGEQDDEADEDPKNQ